MHSFFTKEKLDNLLKELPANVYQGVTKYCNVLIL